ncbi:glycosyltransferase family 4 protein [Desulfogranum mediterraneum]
MTPAQQPTLGMILKGYPRISETFISNEILVLERLGIPVRIFSMRLPRESFCHDSVKEIQARVDYLPTDLWLDFPRLLLPTTLYAMARPSRFLAALARAGTRFQRTRSLGTLKHLMQGCYLSQHLLEKSPEVVHLHAHFAHSPSSVAMFASMLSGLPFSFTAHAKDIYTSNPAQLQEKIKEAEMVVTCTQHNVEYLRSIAGTTATPLHCVYHGIDLRLFAPPAVPKQTAPPFRILTVARLTEKKGLPDILKALVLLREQQLPFQFTLIGDGDDRDELMAQIVACGLREQTRWLGTLPHHRVIEELRNADLFVLGCRIAASGDRDGIPNVLVESLAMALPAVGTRVSALPEILHNEETGLTVPPDNPAALAEAMMRLLNDQELRARVRAAGQRHVAENFDNQVLIERLAELYRQAIPQLRGD